MNNLIICLLVLNTICTLVLIVSIAWDWIMAKRIMRNILLEKQITASRRGSDEAIYARLQKIDHDKTSLKIKIFNFFQKIIMEIRYKMNLK